MFKGISLESEPIEKFRERVRRMSDEELIHQGKLVGASATTRSRWMLGSSN
jgi:hypothetical protein